jgi:hypothetical protein
MSKCFDGFMSLVVCLSLVSVLAVLVSIEKLGKKAAKWLVTIAVMAMVAICGKTALAETVYKIDDDVVYKVVNGIIVSFADEEGTWQCRTIFVAGTSKGDTVFLDEDNFPWMFSGITAEKGQEFTLCLQDGVEPWILELPEAEYNEPVHEFRASR